MKRVFLIPVLVSAAWAQAPGSPEPLSAWPYFKELQQLRGYAGLAVFSLDRETLDRARPDAADLRLYDSAGHEIPYVLRVRHEVETQSEFTAREFNRAVEGTAAVVSCDLGEQSQQEHNVVEIDTAGANFRRLADVQGSPDGVAWSTLASRATLFRFSAAGRTVEQAAVAYPPSRFRYLRVRVESDPQVETAAPTIAALRVRRTVHVTGERESFPAALEGRDADRFNGRPASVWRIDLGGRIPFERLVFAISDAPFSRPFQVEIVDDPAAPELIASGDLTKDATVDFPEHFGRRLKLTVVDDRNPPLSVTGITAISAARQVVFEWKSVGTGPVRVYYGNPKALAPHYDLGVRIPANPDSSAVRLTLTSQRDNPVYRAEPKPLSERSPWLIYAVLALASLALAAILWNLAVTAQSQTESR